MSGPPEHPQVLTAQTKAGVLYNTYTTAKSVLNPEDLITLPANYLAIGSAFFIQVSGGLSNRASTPGSVTFQVMMGSIVAFTTGALSFQASARTLLPFTLDIKLRVDSTGSGTAAKFLGMGEFGGIHLTNTDTKIQVPVTAPAVGTGFDSTIANVLDFWTGFSTSDAGNGVQLYDYRVRQDRGL